MSFWWLTIGFTVVWVIAVVIEVIWFWGPSEEEEEEPDSASVETGLEAPLPPTRDASDYRQETAVGG